jgi:AmmeMemoRadiSam system protein B
LLPFLQSALNNSFEILPVLFGNDLRIGGEINDNYRILAEKLSRYLGPAYIIVISNDMAHDFKGNYCSEASDQQILKIIEDGNYEALDAMQKQYLDRAEMHGNVISCGIDGIKTGLAYFEKIGGGCIKTLGYGNTDKDGFFVGYGTMVMVKTK